MVYKSENTLKSKVKRTITSVLPVSKKRKGECIQCGMCCRLPFKCIFLKQKDDGVFYCSVHKIRPLNCRKYPRTKNEHITSEKCGYCFE